MYVGDFEELKRYDKIMITPCCLCKSFSVLTRQGIKQEDSTANLRKQIYCDYDLAFANSSHHE